MYDYSSLEQAINEIAYDYKTHGSEKQSISDAIKPMLFKYSYFMIIDKTGDEDLASSLFMDAISGKVKSILNSYDSSKGTFIMYFRNLCFMYYRYKKLAAYKEESRSRMADGLAGTELIKTAYEREYDSESHEGMIVGEPEGSYGKPRKRNTMRTRDQSNKAQAARSHIGFRKACLLTYVLRNANMLDSEMIEKITDYLHLSENQMYDLIGKAKLASKSRTDMADLHMEMSEGYFAKMMMLEKRMELTGARNDEKFKRKRSKYFKLKGMHAEKAKSLLKVRHADIASILNIRYDMVRRMIYKAKNILQSMKKERTVRQIHKGNTI